MLPVKLRFVGQTHVGFLNQVRDLQAGTLILKQAPGEAAKFPISPGSQTGKRGLGRPWPRRALVACGPGARWSPAAQARADCRFVRTQMWSQSTRAKERENSPSD